MFITKLVKPMIIIILLIISVGCTKKYSELKISLDSNPSTGYLWNYEISNEDIVNISQAYDTNCKNNVSGCGGKNIYTITPKKEGEVTITFKYARNFGKDDHQLIAKYKIKVDKDLKITEKHSGNYFTK